MVPGQLSPIIVARMAGLPATCTSFFATPLGTAPASVMAIFPTNTSLSLFGSSGRARVRWDMSPPCTTHPAGTWSRVNPWGWAPVKATRRAGIRPAVPPPVDPPDPVDAVPAGPDGLSASGQVTVDGRIGG